MLFPLATTLVRSLDIDLVNKIVEDSRRELFQPDILPAFFDESVYIVDEDDYLRYRISVAFNALMKKLFDAHKKDALPEEQAGALQELKAVMEEYPKQKTADEKAMYKYHLLTKQLGLDTRHLTEEENRLLMNVIERSSVLKRGRRGR